MRDDPPAWWWWAALAPAMLAAILLAAVLAGWQSADRECRQMCRGGYLYSPGSCVCIVVAHPIATR